MAVVIVGTAAFTLTKTLPAGASSGYASNALHVEVIYPNKTVKWFDSSEIPSDGVSLQFQDSTAAGADPIANPAAAGSIVVGCVPSTEGRYKVTLYSGTVNGAYTKVASKSVKAVLSNTKTITYIVEQSQTF